MDTTTTPIPGHLSRLVGCRVSFHVEGSADAPWPIHMGRITSVNGEGDLMVADDSGTITTLRPYMVKVVQ